MKDKAQKDYLTPKEIAVSLNVSYVAVLALLNTKNIKAKKVNCRWQIKPNDFAAFKARNKRAIEKLEQEYVGLYWQGLNPDQLEKRVAEDFRSRSIIADKYGFATNAIYKSLLPKQTKEAAHDI